jgi:hypothetical protein
MKTPWICGLVIAASVGAGTSNLAWGAPALPAGCRVALGDPASAQQAVATLRDAGPAGLDAVLAEYDESHDPRLLPVIDAVAGQRDAVHSRLYWYTDLQQAEATAGAARNPLPYHCRGGEFNRMIESFQHSVALDTVHNNYQLRRKALAWLREAPAQVRVEELNRRVYAELFMTPGSDPWLGLMPEATYTGLTGDGCVVDAQGK